MKLLTPNRLRLLKALRHVEEIRLIKKYYGTKDLDWQLALFKSTGDKKLIILKNAQRIINQQNDPGEDMAQDVLNIAHAERILNNT